MISEGVLVIYTGGTIGSIHKDKENKLSPLVSATLDEVVDYFPNYDNRDKKIVISGKEIRLELDTLDNPIDSSNINSTDWLDIARRVRDNYDKYEGFVILHGTDTMAYTSSALAFLFDQLTKPIIITGAQKPIAQTRTDAIQNLVTSIEIAAAKTLGTPVIPEVCVFFREKLLRGCRTTKYSASNLSGFISPNFPDLGHADEHIVINRRVIREPGNQNLRLKERFEENIVSITVFPGIRNEVFDGIINSPKIKGVILRTFGTGNAPTNPKFLEAIASLNDNGKIVVNVSQCMSGEVEQGLYDVSSGLMSRGVVSGMDLTDEAALTKLGTILAESEDPDPDIIKDKFTINYRGEQRQSIFNIHYEKGKIYETTIAIEQKREMVEAGRYDAENLEKAFLNLIGLNIKGNKGEIKLAFFIDMPEADESHVGKVDNYLETITSTYRKEDGKINSSIEITEAARKFINNKYNSSLTVVNFTGYEISWDKTLISLYTNG